MENVFLSFYQNIVCKNILVKKDNVWIHFDENLTFLSKKYFTIVRIGDYHGILGNGKGTN